MKYSIDAEIVNKLLSYLGEIPFKEVAQLITELSNDAKPLPKVEPVCIPNPHESKSTCSPDNPCDAGCKACEDKFVKECTDTPSPRIISNPRKKENDNE